jgi:DNA-binding NarL/FixJ family response regulator
MPIPLLLYPSQLARPNHARPCSWRIRDETQPTELVRNYFRRCRGLTLSDVSTTKEALLNIIILTPVRLFGEGLATCIDRRPGMSVRAVISDLESLRVELSTSDVQLVLVDVTQGLDLFDLRALAHEWAPIPFVALGLTEQRQTVIECGRAGFSGYVSRDASIDGLCAALADSVAGRLACPPEISGGMLRALFHEDETRGVAPDIDLALTRREGEVLELLGRGLSNKEIGEDLCVSVATVKHHVHNVLEKLQLPKRAQAMRLVRDAPWLGRTIAHKKRA